MTRNTTGMSPDQIQATVSITRAIPLLGCLQFCVNVGASWVNRHVLPQLLNHQAQLELRLEAEALMSQPKRNSPSQEQFKRILIFALASLGGLFPILIVSVNLKPHADYILEMFVNSFVLASIGFSDVLHEFVVISAN